MGKYLLTIAIPDYRPSIENVELSSLVQHNASPDKNSRTTVMVSFLDVTGIKPCPNLSPNQNALRITSGTEPTLIRCRPRVATANLSNSCTCGLERFRSARNDTFVDPELCSYTRDGTALLQLSDHSSTCEVVQDALKDNHIARNASVQPTASSAAIQAQVAPSLEAPVSFRTKRRGLAEVHWDCGAHYVCCH
ncbi:uncharacterized protein TNCV_464921 [Trichonephila clavipes]|nr:uncharacterized protein TNCV_464921 [Trichonephila clavipes]